MATETLSASAIDLLDRRADGTLVVPAAWTFPKPWRPMVEIIPEGRAEHGTQSAEIRYYHLDADTERLSRLRAGIGHRAEFCPQGVYCQLWRNRGLWMSDTKMERDTNYDVVTYASGRVLIAGLGIGMVVAALLDRTDRATGQLKVDHITIVEKDPLVIQLVAPAIRKLGGDRVTIVEGDIWTWKPARGSRFDAIYFDIWQNICRDNLRDMTRLHRRFRPYLAKTGRRWMDSWMREDLKAGWA